MTTCVPSTRANKDMNGVPSSGVPRVPAVWVVASMLCSKTEGRAYKRLRCGGGPGVCFILSAKPGSQVMHSAFMHEYLELEYQHTITT